MTERLFVSHQRTALARRARWVRSGSLRTAVTLLVAWILPSCGRELNIDRSYPDDALHPNDSIADDLVENSTTGKEAGEHDQDVTDLETTSIGCAIAETPSFVQLGIDGSSRPIRLDNGCPLEKWVIQVAVHGPKSLEASWMGPTPGSVSGGVEANGLLIQIGPSNQGMISVSNLGTGCSLNSAANITIKVADYLNSGAVAVNLVTFVIPIYGCSMP